MARALINRGGKNSVRNLQYGPRTRLVRGICPQDLWSTTVGKPPSDTSQDYDLIAASESDGSTVVEFSRAAVTGDDKDVQFMVRSL